MHNFLLILLILSTNIVAAQRTVSGLVTDKTDKPIQGVTVSAKSSSAKATTDASGKYTIEISESCSSLEFSKKGFKVQASEITGNIVNVTMILLADVSIFELSLDELLNVEVITASKNKQTVNTAPATIYVVTEQDIIENGYLELKNVIENVPSMSFVNSDFFSDGGQRGVTGDFSKTLILMNGREMKI